MRLDRFRNVTCTAVIAMGVFYAAPATAHDALVTSDPAAGATLSKAPGTMKLTFSEGVLAVGDAISIKSPDGSTITRKPTVNGSVVTAPLSAHENGTYHVTWRVTSADGHPVSGSYDFTLQGQQDTSTGSGGAAGGLKSPSASTVNGPTTPTTNEPGDNQPTLVIGGTIAACVALVGALFIARSRVRADRH